MPTQTEVKVAEERLLEIVSTNGTGDGWSPKELRQEASNGLPFETISLAFWRLLNRGELELGDDHRVRRARAAAHSPA